MRRALAALLLSVVAGSAQAADGAQSRPIGFSPDRRYFAFEQYGVQDGSGFAYSDIFVIDLSNDSWVKGSLCVCSTSRKRETSTPHVPKR